MPVEGYLLDTMVASAGFDELDSKHKETRDRLDQRGKDLIYVCAASIGEIEFGMKIAPSVDSLRQSRVRDAMAQYECLPIDRHTTEIYSSIKAVLFEKFAPKNAKGRVKKKYVDTLVDPTTGLQLGIDENDLWIVSVAKEFNLVFVTRDRGGGMARILEAGNYAYRTEYW